MIDIHCHLLPNIDDGPQDWGQSLTLARLVVEAGIETSIITPHFIPGVYRWKLEEAEGLHRQFIEKLSETDVPLKSYLAAEVAVFPELPEWISRGKVPLMPTGKHLLLETPLFGGTAILSEMTFSILSMEITPIIAHPERNPIFGDRDFVRELISNEVELQVDAGSLLGTWGGGVKKLSYQLIDRGLVRYLASDCHGAGKREPGELLLAAREIERVWGAKAAEDLTQTNPSKLILSSSSEA